MRHSSFAIPLARQAAAHLHRQPTLHLHPIFPMSRKIRYAMIGGGRGAFIGAVHRIAANIDGQIELAAGAFSADPAKSRASGADLFLEPSRVYGSFEELVKKEAALGADERIDF